MFIIYDLIFLVFAFIYLPVYLCKRKFHPGFQMRLGILPSGLKLNRPIWIHAVSVGEVMAVKNLARELRITYPDKKLFISTVTPTGNKIARSIAGETGFASYCPLDLSFIVRSVVDKVKPFLFIIMETEIWPNLISYLYCKNIPIVLVNGRLSDRSFKGYLSIKFLLKPILSKINLFCVQTPSDAERLLRLGVSQDKIQITGNMKFDNTDYADLKEDYTDYKLKLALEPEEKLFVAGSTHADEEEIILGVYKNLLKEFPYLRLLIAPRHPERAREIEKITLKNGFSSIFISTLHLKPNPVRNTNLLPKNKISNGANTYNLKPIFILDTIGELVSFYAIADIIFVGGSLTRKGGHNILEPASLGKPVIFGPYMFNFRDIARLFLENKACILAHNKEELFLNIKDLLRNPGKSTQLSQRAKAIILQNQGATSRNLKCIEETTKLETLSNPKRKVSLR